MKLRKNECCPITARDPVAVGNKPKKDGDCALAFSGSKIRITRGDIASCVREARFGSY